MALMFHVYLTNQAVTAERNRLTLQYQEKFDESLKKARLAEQQLYQSALNAEREKNEKIVSINRKLERTISSLQSRPSRNTSSTTSETNRACTGAELYREDGQFLAREAARAERVLEERDYYYNEYERARRTLDSLANEGR